MLKNRVPTFLNRFFETYKENFLNFIESIKLEKLSISKLFNLEVSKYEKTNCYHLETNSDIVTDFKSDNLIITIPVLNPTGLKELSRTNINKVDLNRNLPSKNWEYQKLKVKGEANPYYPGEFPKSEIETQFLTQIIENNKIDLIISFHTNHFVQNKNEAQINYDGAAKYKIWAKDLAKLSDLTFTEDIGYPTPGSLGSYAKDLNIDCVTVEFEDSFSEEKIFEDYQKAFFKSIKELFNKGA